MENPTRNKIVCKKAFLLKIPFPSFRSLMETPVIYERKAGYKGREQGEINDKRPAPNARNKLICSKKIPPYCLFSSTA